MKQKFRKTSNQITEPELPTPHYDYIIVGAGPAGSATASLLAQEGHTVALVDDANPTEWRVGESLPGAATRLLNRLGIEHLEKLLAPEHFKSCTANASAWGSDVWQFQDALRNPEGGGWHLMRHEFDKALKRYARHSGATAIAARVHNSVQRSDGSFELTLKEGGHLHSNYLIDATGRSSAMARRLGMERQRVVEQLAAYTWLKPNAGDEDNTTRVKSVAHGWWYTSRLPNNYRVLAYHGNAETVSSMQHSPQQFVEACNATDIIPPTPDGQYPLKLSQLHQSVKAHDAGISKLIQPYGHRWLAVGDAALSFDPLSSQGIFFALYSAIRGAEALLNGSEQALAQYAARVHSVFEGNIRSGREFMARVLS